MTIEFQGHVENMARGIGDKIAVTLVVEAVRSREKITIIAERGEVAMYYPGMPVMVQIRPLGKP